MRDIKAMETMSGQTKAMKSKKYKIKSKYNGKTKA